MSYQLSVEHNKRAIRGLRTVRTSASVVTINPGACMDRNRKYAIELLADRTVDIAVSGINGLDTGIEAADTWYSVWLVSGPSGTGGLLSIADGVSTQPTLPAGYDVAKRRVSWVRNAGTDFRDYHVYQLGTSMVYLFDEDLAGGELTVVFLGNATVMTTVACAVGMPPTCEHGVFILGHSYPAGATAIATTFLNKNANAQASPSFRATGRRTTGHSDAKNIQDFCESDGSQQMQYRVDSVDLDAVVDIFGWIDQREKDGF